MFTNGWTMQPLNFKETSHFLWYAILSTVYADLKSLSFSDILRWTLTSLYRSHDNSTFNVNIYLKLSILAKWLLCLLIYFLHSFLIDWLFASLFARIHSFLLHVFLVLSCIYPFYFLACFLVFSVRISLAASLLDYLISYLLLLHALPV